MCPPLERVPLTDARTNTMADDDRACRDFNSSAPYLDDHRHRSSVANSPTPRPTHACQVQSASGLHLTSTRGINNNETLLRSHDTDFYGESRLNQNTRTNMIRPPENTNMVFFFRSYENVCHLDC